MAEQVLIAFCTFPDAETARRIVKEIVDLRLAACGNIIPQVESIYRWQGKVESNGETLVIFKLTADRYPEFEKKLQSLHPYEVAEIISFKIDNGSQDYLRWVSESCAD
jgi:periplasmic divalent cation tolerance protein